MSELDPRLSDEATGLPPLQTPEDATTVLVLAWYVSEGIATNPLDDSTPAVRYLHVRGLIRGEGDTPTPVEWTQAYLAIPAQAVPELAAMLLGLEARP